MELQYTKDYIITYNKFTLKSDIDYIKFFELIQSKNISDFKLSPLSKKVYKHKLKNLPFSINTLEINSRYRYPLNTISSHIKKIIINGYDLPIYIFPNGVENIEIIAYNKKIKCSIPLKIKQLEGICEFTQFLPYLERLSIKDNYPLPHLSENLKYLDIGDYYNHNLYNLPEKLNYLRIGKGFEKEIKLPEKLETLIFDHESDFNNPLVLNKNLKVLELPSNYIYILNLPPSLTYLSVGRTYKNVIDLIKQQMPNLFINYSRIIKIKN